MPAGQGTAPGFVPVAFCAVPLAVPLLAPLAVGGFPFAPLADAWPGPLALFPVGALAPAALTQGAPVEFTFGLLAVALPGD